MIGALIGAGAGLLGSVISGKAAGDAADSQTRSANKQIDLQKRMYNDQVDRFQPYADLGQNALMSYANSIGLQNDGTFNLEQSDAARYALETGVDQIESGAAARGGLFSGRTAQDLEDYRMNIALSDRDSQLNRLANLGGTGIQAAGLVGNAQNNLTQGVSNALGSIGNANAASSIATGNALNAGLNTALEGYQMYQQTQNNPWSQQQPAQPWVSAGGYGQGIY